MLSGTNYSHHAFRTLMAVQAAVIFSVACCVVQRILHSNFGVRIFCGYKDVLSVDNLESFLSTKN